MILSWKGKQAREVFEGNCPKGFPADLFKRVRRSLFQLDAATRLDDRNHPPGNRLHRLHEDRAGQWSISVNDQFRICFRWTRSRSGGCGVRRLPLSGGLVERSGIGPGREKFADGDA